MTDFYASYPVPVGAVSGGTVTEVDTGTGLTGGPITTTGTVSLVVPVVIANGGTNSTTALNNNRVMQSSGGKIVEASAITASKALASDANGIPVASATTATELGYVSGVTSSIQTQLDAKQPALTTGNLTDAGTDGITVTGGTGAVIGTGTSIAQHVADSTHNGYLSSADWSTFNGKQPALTTGNLTDAGTDGITVTGGTGAVIGTGTSIAQHVADSTHNGYLSSTDWSTFNGKQASGSYITALTGDVTASGPGSSAATVAKIQSTVVSGTTGSGNVVFSTSPTLVTPALGVPASGTLTSCTGLPLTTGVTLTLGVGNGGTGIASGTSGGILGFTASGTIASSGALTAHGVVVGGGAGATPTNIGVGTTGQLLVGATGADPAFSSTVGALTTFSSGVTFGSATLANYEETTASVTFNTGAFTTSPQTITAVIRRIGKIVTVEFPTVSNTTNVTNAEMSTSGTPLSAYAPAAPITFPIGTKLNGGAFNSGYCQINANGSVVVAFWPDDTTVVAANSTQAGFRRFAVTYTLA